MQDTPHVGLWRRASERTPSPRPGGPPPVPAHVHRAHTETTSAMQRFRLPLSPLMVMGRSSLILHGHVGQSS